jgi:hypothetical protein
MTSVGVEGRLQNMEGENDKVLCLQPLRTRPVIELSVAITQIGNNFGYPHGLHR